jgi:hypothetical protein
MFWRFMLSLLFNVLLLLFGYYAGDRIGTLRLWHRAFREGAAEYDSRTGEHHFHILQRRRAAVSDEVLTKDPPGGGAWLSRSPIGSDQ